MLRAMKRKLADFIRAQVEITTNAHQSEVLRVLRDQHADLLKALRQQGPLLEAVSDRVSRATGNERDEMKETQRMIAIACARIENFIKVQNDRSTLLEESIAALVPQRIFPGGSP